MNSAPEGGTTVLTDASLFDGSRTRVALLPNLPKPPEPTPEAAGLPQAGSPTITKREEPASKDIKS